VLVYSLLLLVVGAEVGYLSGNELQTSLAGWSSDGAAPGTFWSSAVIELPGLEVTDLHCHGLRTLDLQVGAARPAHNPCYSGNYNLTTGWSVYLMLPGGHKAIYQSFVKGGPYTYYVGDLI